MKVNSYNYNSHNKTNYAEKQNKTINQLTRLPDHVDVIPVNFRIEQNLIISDLKKIFDIENFKLQNNTLDKENLTVITKKPHLVTFNTGRPLFWLYLKKNNNRQVAFLIDKKLQNYWQIKSQFSPEYYKSGALFEVNLLKVNNQYQQKYLTLEQQLNILNNNEHFTILIHDIFMLNGKLLFGPSLGQRFNQIVEMFKNSCYQYNPCDLIEYQFKPYVQYQYLESLWFDYRPKTNYKKDIQGIIFCPIESSRNEPKWTNYLYFINDNVKRPERHVTINCQSSIFNKKTFNFLVKKTDKLDNYQLYANDCNQKLKYIDIALVNDLDTSRFLQDKMENTDSCIFVCEYDLFFKKWKPIQLSTKDNPDTIGNFVEKFI